MRDIQRELQHTEAAFFAQCARRDELVEALTDRLKLQDSLEYEKFFFRYFSGMNREEKSIFDQIRAMTEGSLYQGNKTILRILLENPALLDVLPRLADLQQHLVFWLNKYERVFTRTPEMCLLYTGVEDGVPFPEGLDAELTKAAANRPEATQKHELTNTSLAVIGANSPSVQ